MIDRILLDIGRKIIVVISVVVRMMIIMIGR